MKSDHNKKRVPNSSPCVLKNVGATGNLFQQSRVQLEEGHLTLIFVKNAASEPGKDIFPSLVPSFSKRDLSSQGSHVQFQEEHLTLTFHDNTASMLEGIFFPNFAFISRRDHSFQQNRVQFQKRHFFQLNRVHF